MGEKELIKIACDFLGGNKIFDKPIFGFCDCEDEYFYKLKDHDIIGDHFKLPKQWLSEGKTVISFFLPFNETIRKSNSVDNQLPSMEWSDGKKNGQKLLNDLSIFLNSYLTEEGYKSIIPSMDKSFYNEQKIKFTSNWSERHVAFACGLGTFGLSKGIITESGMAGRFSSIVTELHIPKKERKYKDVYEYCTNCGVCIHRCPVNAISIEHGKDHNLCANFLDELSEKSNPLYGCGKCQTKVPCEHSIPK
ncbi:epoxyqueuosine reductase [Romboutsia weinsteinii]|uniref:Epoxyqueuosine reductase n=1 Tax=Romboutsia weinsteinii TaxID=2020949 RepID=A0A371IX70_9FIRM|nr:4Fe-4S binding protein [Romboutsia weinsteinii]RDY25074.1 epoxyqueuosine reductase [Romboutsia weinsteinii]